MRIVAMTAHAMKGDRERCLAAGMDGYLSKPIKPKLLFDVVEEGSGGVKPASGVFGRGGLVDPLAGDTELRAETTDLFLRECPRRLAEIRSAIDRREPELVRSTAQALKGAAATVGATGVFEASQTIERLCAEGRFEPLDAAWRRLSGEATLVLEALRDSHPLRPGLVT